MTSRGVFLRWESTGEDGTEEHGYTRSSHRSAEVEMSAVPGMLWDASDGTTSEEHGNFGQR